MCPLWPKFNSILRRDHQKKNPMSVANMSRYRKRAYLRLCLEKKTNLIIKGLKGKRFMLE